MPEKMTLLHEFLTPAESLLTAQASKSSLSEAKKARGWEAKIAHARNTDKKAIEQFWKDAEKTKNVAKMFPHYYERDGILDYIRDLYDASQPLPHILKQLVTGTYTTAASQHDFKEKFEKIYGKGGSGIAKAAEALSERLEQGS
jgi:hypothetical protein